MPKGTTQAPCLESKVTCPHCGKRVCGHGSNRQEANADAQVKLSRHMRKCHEYQRIERLRRGT